MTMILGFLVAGALFQQPRQQTVPTPAQVRQSVAPALNTPLDTTVAALSDVGTKVAELRTAYDLLRRAAYNEPDGAVAQRATNYATKCRALATGAIQAQQRIRGGSVPTNIRPALLRYRDYLPSLSRMGQQCASRMQQLHAKPGGERAVAEAVRADIEPQGSQLYRGLTPYEDRLRDLRVAFGWEVPNPRRPG